MEKVHNDTTTPDTRLSDNPNPLNPATIGSLVELMLGGMAPRHGCPLHCRPKRDHMALHFRAVTGHEREGGQVVCRRPVILHFHVPHERGTASQHLRHSIREIGLSAKTNVTLDNGH